MSSVLCFSVPYVAVCFLALFVTGACFYRWVWRLDWGFCFLIVVPVNLAAISLLLLWRRMCFICRVACAVRLAPPLAFILLFIFVLSLRRCGTAVIISYVLMQLLCGFFVI